LWLCMDHVACNIRSRLDVSLGDWDGIWSSCLTV